MLGYVSHLVGVSSESLMSLSLLIFFFTFISDLVDAQFTVNLMTNAVFRLSTNWETSVEISSDSIIGRRVSID
ncbi:hypothetical protein HOLleu_36605 [Holothuria leucospilota]|uniref:Uncharacterized protein n=1 Tax=Holothuria leucospilota TaxID=206669 RepID=A0A9Q1BFS7_HOLLE|nr:hypothetical protein HOLleu_36605 [Holothuria leucospilota]